MELSPGSFTGPDIVGEYVQKFVILKCHEQGVSQNYDPHSYVILRILLEYYILTLSYTLTMVLALLDPSDPSEGKEGAQRIALRRGDTFCVLRGNIYVNRAAK